MRHEEQVHLIERALALIAARDSDGGDASTSPLARYLDRERLAHEIERVLRPRPVAVAPSSALGERGAWRALDVLGVPVLLQRADDGRLRAFVNACRHRGARLAAAGSGGLRRGAIVCPYHAWSYRQDGRLAGLPHPADFPQLDRAECALAPLPVAEACGLVWVVADPAAESAAPLRLQLGRFVDELEHWGYDRYFAFHEREFESVSNWKLTFDANLETYHFQYAHRDTIAELFHDNIAIADFDGAHQRIVLPKRSIAQLADLPRDEWRLAPHANIIYFFFPATFLLFIGDHATVFSVEPLAIDRSRVRSATLVPEPPATERAREHWQRNVDLFWAALDEDFALSASVQSTLRAIARADGARAALNLGRTEWCATRFHADVERLLASPAG